MAFDHTGLFTVLGKYIKLINTMNGYVSALESGKDAIFTVLEGEDLEDYYTTLPGLTTGFQSNVNSWINSLINECKRVIVDRDYVLEQLVLNSSDVTTVLNTIYDYMKTNNYSLKPSVVSIGGSDVDKNRFLITRPSPYDTINAVGNVFVTRTLDGVSAPSSVVSAHLRYNGIESQLAKSTTVYARVTSPPTSSSSKGTVELFSTGPVTGPYQLQEEEPGSGPSLSDVEGANLVGSNWNFTTFTSHNPDNWTMSSGTAGTDWTYVGGDGGLDIKTDGIYCKRQLTGLSNHRTYLVAAYVIGEDAGAEADVVVDIEVQNNTGTTTYASGTTGNIVTAYTPALGVYEYSNGGLAYCFLNTTDDINLNNLYVKVTCSTLSSGSAYIKKVVCAPVTYYNGLGFAYWNPGNYTFNFEKDYGSIAVSNNNAGVFQTFFRQALNVQMPTNDTNTVNDALAT